MAWNYNLKIYILNLKSRHPAKSGFWRAIYTHLFLKMYQDHEDGCGCSAHSHSTAQTLSELEFERGIWTAAIENDMEKVKKLLNQGHDPNKRDNSGYTALHYAARGGYTEVLITLLNHGADSNSQTPSGNTTALHRAAYMGHLDSIKILLMHGARAELIDSDRKSALHKCAEKGHYTCAQLILDQSAANFEELVNMQDTKGNTAYDICLKNDRGLKEWSNLLSKQ